jgi:hypothetical protein
MGEKSDHGTKKERPDRGIEKKDYLTSYTSGCPDVAGDGSTKEDLGTYLWN